MQQCHAISWRNTPTTCWCDVINWMTSLVRMHWNIIYNSPRFIGHITCWCTSLLASFRDQVTITPTIAGATEEAPDGRMITESLPLQYKYLAWRLSSILIIEPNLFQRSFVHRTTKACTPNTILAIFAISDYHVDIAVYCVYARFDEFCMNMYLLHYH